jgi:hypothetical protein
MLSITENFLNQVFLINGNLERAGFTIERDELISQNTFLSEIIKARK